MIYEGLKTRVEDKLISHQSRYAFSVQWCDLDQIVPSPGFPALGFAKTTKISRGTIYNAVKAMNVHTTLAINTYLTAGTRAVILEKITIGSQVNDENDLQWLSEVI